MEEVRNPVEVWERACDEVIKTLLILNRDRLAVTHEFGTRFTGWVRFGGCYIVETGNASFKLRLLVNCRNERDFGKVWRGERYVCG